METFLKRSIKKSYNTHYKNEEGVADQTIPLDSIFLASTSFIEIKRVIVWFFLISDCTVFRGKLTLKGKMPYFWNLMKRPSIATFIFRLSPLNDFLEINKVFYNDL